MSSIIIPDEKDTSESGREEDVIVNSDDQQKNNNDNQITNLPIKDRLIHKETEGERRFKEGLANNDDATTKNP